MSFYDNNQSSNIQMIRDISISLKSKLLKLNTFFPKNTFLLDLLANKL